MGETRRKFDQDFREGAVRLVRETGKPVAQVARDLGNWSMLTGAAGTAVTGSRARTSGRSWSGCGRRTPCTVALADRSAQAD